MIFVKSEVVFLIISFDYCWTLDKKLSNFASLPWKLHKRYCHNEGFAFATADMKERLKELDKKANRTSLSLKNVYGLSGYNQTLGSMQTTLMAAGPQFANDGDAMATAASSSAAEDIRVVDIFTLLCNLLEVEPPQPQVASGQINRVKSLLRYPSDTQVVKVIRNWMVLALMPENVPITSNTTF